MSDEIQDIQAFLSQHAPFRELDRDTLARVAGAIDVRYCRAGTRIVEYGQEAQSWHIVRSGAVEVFRRDGSLYNRLTEGGYFGEFGLLHRKRVRYPAVALEDTLLYLLPEPVFSELFEQNEAFADQVDIEDRSRLHKAVSRQRADSDLLATTVGELVQREPVTLPADATAQQAAVRMTEAGVSSLLLVRDAQSSPADGTSGGAADDNVQRPPQQIAGIVTDRDLRTRLLAAGLPHDTPALAIATQEVVTIKDHRLAFEAMGLMLRHRVHHLPVMRQQAPIGVLSLSDIVQYESHNGLFVVGRIGHAQSVDELESLVPEVRACFLRMVQEDSGARVIEHLLSAIGRAFKQRLLELGEQSLGQPPVPYCFLALGSMARQEQGMVTDQDNAMVLDDRFVPERDDAYFSALASFVSDGLARCGYPYCSGGVMATTARWRQPLRTWRAYFDEWMQRPTPEGLLNSNIFFDLEGVHGRTEWADALRRHVAQQARHHPRFLASMTRNALLRTPPLGFFKDFVLEADGRHSAAINLKRRGTAPLTDLIRVYALAVGSQSLNSFDRLNDVVRAQALPPGRGPDLHDALEFIAAVRLRNQADDLKAGREPDNSLEPERLSDFERKRLRDAFTVLSHAQDYLKFRYGSGRAA